MKLSHITQTYGRTPFTTARVVCNQLAYAFVRSVKKTPKEGWLYSQWHWSKSPFSLQRHVLWSCPLRAWFYVEDETSIEVMLHMPTYEPVSWVAPEPGNVFIDVGAHTGWYTIQAARAIGPAGRVIALEPDETNRRQLERNVSLNEIKNHTIIPTAVWSKSGSVQWSPGQASVWHKIDEAHGTQTVRTVTLDDLVSQLSLPSVDWIKMDIEGAEVDAIKGAEQLLRRFRPVLFIEIHETLEQVKGLLGGLGYSIDKAEFDQPPDRHGWILARCP